MRMKWLQIKLWFKKLYSINYEDETKNRYLQMSNLELAYLLSDEDLRPEAIQIAKNILTKRLNLNAKFTPSEVFDIILNRLNARCKMCHICREQSPSKKHDFFLCKEAGTKVNWSHLISGTALNLITAPVFGIGVVPLGNTYKQYQTVKLSLCLCDSCNSKNKNIPKNMCTNHPLVEFYKLSGFNEVMWPSELRPTR